MSLTREQIEDWREALRNVYTIIGSKLPESATKAAYAAAVIQTDALCDMALRALEPAPAQEPFAWVIPGDDNARDGGWLDARIDKHGEFTRPLYTAPQPQAADSDEAYAILRALSREYDRDQFCDGRKINALIERGQTLLARAAPANESPVDSQPSEGVARATRNCLQDLSSAIAALGRYGFDKDATKDATAFTLWANLNTAQAQAKQTLADTTPAPVAAEEGPMNLLRKCVTGLEAEADGGWSPAAKSHLSKARVALNMLPAPANESPVDSQTSKEKK